MDYKACTKCGKILPASIEYFHKLKNGKYGLHSRCKDCISQSHKENRAARSEYNRQWRESNPEKYQAQRKREKDRYVKNPEKYQVQLGIKKEKYAENPERHRMTVAQYYQDNKEYKKEYVAKWKSDNPEKCRMYQHRRRTKINNAGGNFTAEELEERIEEQGWMCFYCSHPLEDNYHVDHYVPVSKGGSNSIDNIVVACPSCNLLKNDKDPHEFMSFIEKKHTCKYPTL